MPKHRKAGPRRLRLGSLLALVLVSLNLRIAIAAVSPVLGQIQRSTGLSSSLAGLLTTVPIVCFGAFAFVTPRLTGRLGADRLIAVSLVGLLAGVALRLAPSLVALFGGTALIGASIAVANVLMPSLVKRDFPYQIGLVTGLYTMALSAGPALSAGLTVPIEHIAGIGWRPAIALWGVVTLAGLAVWLGRRRPAFSTGAGSSGAASPGLGSADVPPENASLPDDTPPMPMPSLWRDPVAISVAGFMGLQSLGFYSMLAWIPTILSDHGMRAAEAGWLLSFATFPAIAASLATPAVSRRVVRQWIMVVLAVASCAVGYLGLIADPVGLAYLWMAVLGVGQGSAVTLALGYISLRSPDVGHTARLSVMAQGSGYLLASLGPFVIGAVHEATGGWTVPLLLLIAVLAFELLAGLNASRDRHVGAAR
jgi:MFS transporter, CP family, cyanate transporter